MTHILLNDNWKLRGEPLSAKIDSAPVILGQKEGWLSCSLPCDIHMPLIENKIIRDPVLADYCFECEWTEKRSWWFMKNFTVSESELSEEICELVIESIDAHSDIFVNGVHIGHHISAFYPFIRDIKEYLHTGENTLLVRVTTGLETVSDSDLSEIEFAVTHESGNGCPERGDLRRAFVRRPAYSTGWDWGPKVPTCGIVKGAWLDCCSGAVIRGVHAYTVSAEDGGEAVVRVEVESELLSIINSADGDISVEISYQGEKVSSYELKDTFLCSGLNYHTIDLRIDNAKLWYPNGYGEQPLYDVNVSVNVGGKVNSFKPFKMGLRKISIDDHRIDADNRMFAINVNGINIFCKGANWIPCDSIYARASEEKYRRLISEAKECNFNMLRVWGGGFYEKDVFYEECDKNGILIWQDFMFGCAAHPDHLDWFKRETERELDYQTKHLRNHACIVLFCGNNENHWGIGGWVASYLKHEKQFGMYISNNTAVRIVKNNCPDIPYWNSSPYGGVAAGTENCGDAHQWGQFMMNPDMNRRINPFVYEESNAKFVSEYGYPASCRIETIQDYFDGKEIERGNKVWNMHNNTFEKNTVAAGIEKHYIDNPASLPLKTYIFYSGLVQSLMYGYSLETFRAQEFCSGGLYWMYNDTWGEVGWTTLDYYLRRKISYYGVKRAFAPVKLIMRKKGNAVVVTGCNDTADEIKFSARIGYMSLDGRIDNTVQTEITIPARWRGHVIETELPDMDYRNGIFAIIPEYEKVAPEFLRLYDYRELNTCSGEIHQRVVKSDGEKSVVEIWSDTYVHAVCAADCDNVSDNYFDLFPKVKKFVCVTGDIPVFSSDIQ